MSAPIVAVDETTEIGDIARLLEEYRIKRVPVLRAGQMVGIVSRADLVRAIASGTATGAEPAPAPSALSETLAAFEGWRARAAAGGAHKTVAPASAANSSLTAERFRALVAEYRKHQRQEHASAQRAVAARAERDLRELIEHHIDDVFWQATLTKAAEAARHGEREFLLLRFPNRLCSDGGRAINAPLPDWPKTLRGEAAELYIRWQHDLQPHGFRLVARVLEFPGGFPGDIGLFLAWDR